MHVFFFYGDLFLNDALVCFSFLCSRAQESSECSQDLC